MIDLKKLAHELNTQDNRATAYPLFCVEVKRRIYGENMCNPDGSIWVWPKDAECSFDTKEEAIAHFREYGYADAEFIDKLEEIEYEEYWEFDTAHLTEKGANAYIRINGHNLPERRIYVTSQYRCHEFNDLIDWLKEQE